MVAAMVQLNMINLVIQRATAVLVVAVLVAVNQVRHTVVIPV
jgi:hypothetical protein